MRQLIQSEAQRLSAPDAAVIGTDDAGTIVFWNQGAEDRYGWTAREVQGRNVVDVTPATQSREEATNIMSALARGNAWSGTFVVRKKDGTPLLVDVTDTPVLQDGIVIGVIGVSKASERMPTPAAGVRAVR